MRSLYLRKTHAPNEVVVAYFRSRLSNGRIIRKYETDTRSYMREKEKLELSSDWFTYAIPFWLSVIEEYGLGDMESIEALEIGSWEGLSSHFLLHALPHAHVTCVDMWDACDEYYKSVANASGEAIDRIELKFDANLSSFSSRLTKYKGSSFSFFTENLRHNHYDFIYVDGSHHCNDVIVDAIKCFELLKVGGILVFDDYFWKRYSNAIDNPAAAINAFLRLKKGSVAIVRMYDQIMIRKTQSDVRPAS